MPAWKPPLVTYPAPILRDRCSPIDEITDEIRDLARLMLPLMRSAGGIGLSAPQVGFSIRMIAVDIPDSSLGPCVVINPEVLEESEEAWEDFEGCLSLPGILARVSRPKSATITGLSVDGKRLELRTENLLTRCVLHEIDHLNGVLFFDRLTPYRKLEIEGKLRALEYRRPARASRPSTPPGSQTGQL